MQVGYMPVGLGVLAHPDAIVEVAQSAEELGFHSLWVGDHAVFPESFTSPYPYSSEGQFPEAVLKTDFLEPFVALGFMAAHTTRLRLGTGVCILGERNPLTTAKAAATVDRLSRGRLDFGIGIGWLREEYEALGVPWPRRAQRTEEISRAHQAAVGGGENRFLGRILSPSRHSIPIRSRCRSRIHRSFSAADRWRRCVVPPVWATVGTGWNRRSRRRSRKPPNSAPMPRNLAGTRIRCMCPWRCGRRYAWMPMHSSGSSTAACSR